MTIFVLEYCVCGCFVELVFGCLFVHIFQPPRCLIMMQNAVKTLLKKKELVVNPEKFASKLKFDHPISLAAVKKNRFFLLKNGKSEKITYFQIPPAVNCKIVDNQLHVTSGVELDHRNFTNQIHRVNKHLEFGVKKRLILHGLGFRIFNRAVENDLLEFKLGFSHLAELKLPKDIKFTHFKLKGVSNKINITVEGTDAVEVGNFVGRMKHLKPKDVYKGKGFYDKGVKQVLKAFKKK